MDTNLKDRLIQERFPTIMTPRYEALPPCPLHQTRLLMACGGLYIDTLQPFGAFRRCLWFAERDLPYGEVAELDEFRRFQRSPGNDDLRELTSCRRRRNMPTITENGPGGSSGQPRKVTPTCRSISKPQRRAWSSGRGRSFRKTSISLSTFIVMAEWQPSSLRRMTSTTLEG